jgi:hypothetical protein
VTLKTAAYLEHPFLFAQNERVLTLFDPPTPPSPSSSTPLRSRRCMARKQADDLRPALLRRGPYPHLTLDLRGHSPAVASASLHHFLNAARVSLQEMRADPALAAAAAEASLSGPSSPASSSVAERLRNFVLRAKWAAVAAQPALRPPPPGYVCSSCGESGHHVSWCSRPRSPPPGYVCHGCNVAGHFFDKCPRWANPRDNEDNEGKVCMCVQEQKRASLPRRAFALS